MAQVKITDLQAADPLTQSDLIEVVQGGVNKQATVGQVAATVASLTKYKTTVGDGVNVDILITHNLNTRDVHVTCRRATAPYDEISVNNEATSLNSITMKFGAIPPSTNSMVVTVST